MSPAVQHRILQMRRKDGQVLRVESHQLEVVHQGALLLQLCHGSE